MAWYERLLRWSTVHRWKTVLAGLAFFVLSIVGVALVPFSFIPESDSGFSFASVELPPGVRLEETSAATAAAYRMLARQPEVRDVVEQVGDSDEGVRAGELEIALVPKSQRKATQRQFEDRMLEQFRTIPDAQLHFNRNGNGRDVNIYITGDDPQLTYNTARKVVEEMSTLPFVRDARINNDLPRPEILVHPHFDLASQLGVTVQSISDTIRIATLGDLDQNSAKFSLADRQVPIRVSLLEESRKSITTLENLPVPTSSGSTVPLKAVADITFGEGPTRVRRYNQSRRLFVDADLKGMELGPAMKAIYDLPTLKHLPQGVHRVDVGDSKYMNELIGNFFIAMGTGILMVFAVLVLLFARVLQPITILFALPLSIGGVVIALLLTGFSASLGVFIGLLMLMGIVAKNSILLVDFAIEEMRAGKDRVTAILEAGHKRARPIVMTTVAMVAGMMPVALGLGGDTAFRQPMAIAVIGGLITSTALTLVIVPAAFTLIDDVERWLAPRMGRVLVPQPPPAAGPAQPRPVN
jgi:multidrug efflux pump subunit AcrB